MAPSNKQPLELGSLLYRLLLLSPPLARVQLCIIKIGRGRHFSRVGGHDPVTRLKEQHHKVQTVDLILLKGRLAQKLLHFLICKQCTLNRDPL